MTQIQKRMIDLLERIEMAVRVLVHEEGDEGESLHRIGRRVKAIQATLAGQGPTAGGITKQDLIEMEARIMTALGEQAKRIKEFQDQMVTGISNISDDVANLNAQIAKLQASSGAITPDDQALLDQIEATGGQLAASITRLDELTPPPVPST